MACKEGKYNESSPWENELPHTIYFYYAVPTGENTYDKRAYIWVNPDDNSIRPGPELDGLILDLINNANGADTNPRPIGTGFTVPWWKISYFVLAVESNEGFDPAEALDFVHLDGLHERRNHTFFDGGTDMVRSGGKDISVAWTVNHMKTRHGENLTEGESHRFRLGFKLNAKERFDGPDNGTNMGPPIGPP